METIRVIDVPALAPLILVVASSYTNCSINLSTPFLNQPHLALIDAGITDEPNIGPNEGTLCWVGEEEAWTWETTFQIGAHPHWIGIDRAGNQTMLPPLSFMSIITETGTRSKKSQKKTLKLTSNLNDQVSHHSDNIDSFNQPSNNSYSKSHDQDHHLTISNPSHNHQSINFIHQSRIDSPQLSCKTSNRAINKKQSANNSDKENHPGLAITFGKSVTNLPSSVSPVPHHHFQPPSETLLVSDDDSFFNPLPNKTQQTHGTENEITYKTSKIAQDQPNKESSNKTTPASSSHFFLCQVCFFNSKK
ncbi:hypothetical protein O181_096307 [Austropuccinia psidii MF-1]|uniref:Uncharacterized protein n=1 Tax=Austropuccinia psidii MF-1 TaxID=1389203 RepID=A0A9Q3J709_9BASI|nr:hypothetical protein [Austropuccinia psidii MF-1]